MEEQYLGDGNYQEGRNPGARRTDNPIQGRAVEGELPHLLGSSQTYFVPLQTSSLQQRAGDFQSFSNTAQRRGHYPGPQRPSENPLSMSSMAAALPNYQQTGQVFGTINDQRGSATGAASTGLAHQMQHIPQFAGQTHIGSPGYGIGIPSQFGNPFSVSQQNTADSQQYPQQANQRAQSGGSNPAQISYSNSPYISNQQQQQQQYMFYPSPYGPMSPSQQQYQGPQRPQVDVGAAIGGNFPQQGSYPSNTPTGYGYGPGGAYLRPGSASVASGRKGSASGPAAIPSAPRGPPRKPKQSGHALWVGNLPPGTLVTDLKDHFSRDATSDIESVFLISKSNCAFINYRSEAACAAAMTRFHDSRFQGIRLVCRLRRSSQAPSPGVPTGPAALIPSTTQTQSATEAIAQNRRVSSQAEEAASQVEGSKKVSDKYFVVKSLTVEDLELSVRNGIWTTQAHNEEALNKAFETTENVYLIFSANKSGEYFGYARMISHISDEEAAQLDFTPREGALLEDPDLPKSIPTAATEFAPRGRIIDDSARGTIFWEAESADQDTDGVDGDEEANKESADEAEESSPLGQANPHTFGKPFKIEWLSTVRLPFYRTRGLRNPWNANREVKIARDGTELETNVGRRLIQMFPRSLPPGVPQDIPPGAAGPSARAY